MREPGKIRRPAIAGTFYSHDPLTLKGQIEECFTSPIGPGRLPSPSPKEGKRIIALISPHAGYIYSGGVAAHGYLSLAESHRPDLIVLLGPNHTGMGSGVSLMASGTWETPLGRVEIDEDAAREIHSLSEIIDLDDSAHLREHSLEVQLPFLQYIMGGFKIVPIGMMMQDLSTSREVGRAIGEAVEGRNALIIASTDFTHYESQSIAEKKDGRVIDAILSLDEEKVIDTVYRFNVSMCGYGPVAAAITAAKVLGAGRASLLKYATSGDVTGDRYQVVGYASLELTP
jgi:AmmeMemoRadiSam system protein B